MIVGRWYVQLAALRHWYLCLQPVKTVLADDCLQLLSVGVRAAVLSHPAEGLSCNIGECRVCILSDVALDVPFQRHRIETTRKVVPQHDFREGASLDSFRREEVKVGSVLPHRLCEPLLVFEERPSKGGGVMMFAPVLFQDGEDLARGVYFFCPHGRHFLLGLTLQALRSQPVAAGSAMGCSTRKNFASLILIG